MIEIELLILIGLVGVALLVALYAMLTHSPKFDRLLKALEFPESEAQKAERERREAEDRRKTIAEDRKRRYE